MKKILFVLLFVMLLFAQTQRVTLAPFDTGKEKGVQAITENLCPATVRIVGGAGGATGGVDLEDNGDTYFGIPFTVMIGKKDCILDSFGVFFRCTNNQDTITIIQLNKYLDGMQTMIYKDQTKYAGDFIGYHAEVMTSFIGHDMTDNYSYFLFIRTKGNGGFSVDMIRFYYSVKVTK